MSSSSGSPNAFGSFSVYRFPPTGASYEYKITANYSAAWTATTAFTNTVTVQSVTAATAAAPATSPTGSAIATTSLSSALSGAISGATGTITFKVFGPQASAPTTCTSGGTTVGTATVSGNGTYHPSAAYTPNTAGDYWWYASYGGDTYDRAASSTCGSGMAETVVTNSTTTWPPRRRPVPRAPRSRPLGSSVLSGATSGAGGTITFTVFGPQASAPTTCTSGGTTVGTATVSGNGTYHPSATFTTSSAGDYWWYVSYGGDASNSPSASTCGSGIGETVVAKASPAVTAAAPGTGTAGTAIATTSISSVLSGGAGPTGTITFTVFGPQASAPTTCTSGGTAVGTATVGGNNTYNPSASFTPSGPGDYWWYASYGGDSNNNSAASTCGSGMGYTVVAKASPGVTAAGPASGTAGTAIATASISSVLSSGAGATGTITFTAFGPQASAPTTCTSGGTTVGTATVSGNSTYQPSASYTPSAAGDYWWYVTYAGDANNNSATSTCGSGMGYTVVAKASPAATAAAPASATAGTAIPASSISSAFSGSSGSNATGTITFYMYGPSASAPTSCPGSSPWSTIGTATVSGNNTYTSSASVTPTQAGTYWWYTSYNGDTNNNSAASTCGSGMTTETVVKANPAVTGTGPASGTAGTAIATTSISSVFSASSGTNAGGTLTFYAYGPSTTQPTTCPGGTSWTTVGTATVSGNGTYHPSASYTPSAAGDYWWYVGYAGDANNNAEGSACSSGMSETGVGKANPTLSVTGPSSGTNGTRINKTSITATLAASSGTNSGGTITIYAYEGSAPGSCPGSGYAWSSTATVSGNGTYHPAAAYTPSATGNLYWYASYGGDANNNTAASSCP